MTAPEIVKTPFPFFHYYGLLRKVPETYDWEICDICGQKRKCWWYEPLVESSLTGMDFCSACAAKNAAEVNE